MVDFIEVFSHQLDASTTHFSTQIMPVVEDSGEEKEDVEDEDEVEVEVVDAAKTLFAFSEMVQ
jgi:hypothetical protein